MGKMEEINKVAEETKAEYKRAMATPEVVTGAMVIAAWGFTFWLALATSEIYLPSAFGNIPVWVLVVFQFFFVSIVSTVNGVRVAMRKAFYDSVDKARDNVIAEILER